MKILILIKTVARTLYAHLGRSLLTVLGIMIGIAAIIITFSIGRGAEEKIKGQIMWMGEGACYIVSGAVMMRGAARAALFKPIRLTISDMESIKAQVPEIQEISRSTFTLEMMEYGGQATKERVLGSDANILQINKNKLRYGTCFTPQQVTDRVQVAILGEKIATTLFKSEFALDKTIRINGKPFTVIGVIEHQEHFFGPEDPNSRIFVPFTTAKKLFGKEGESEDDLASIAVSFYPGISSQEPLRKIKRILRMRHNIDTDESDDFTIFDQETIANVAQDASGVIKLFGLLAASISLLVGGIGVMNIMLVSIKERVEEIGLRIALGSTQATIQIQFILEAIILCAWGGLIGIVMGLLGIYLVSTFTTLSSIIELTPLVISFLITIAAGIFFGYYPARLASQLNPIDAMFRR